MRIAINASILGKNLTGSGNAVVNILNNFPNKNNLSVYAISDEYINSSYKFFYIPILINFPFSKLIGLQRFFWNQYRLSNFGGKYDIVYCPTTHGSIFLNNQVITVLDLIVYKFPKIHPFQWIYYKLFLPIFLKKSRAIVVISDFVKNDLINNYSWLDPHKVFVVKCGYDQNVFNDNISNSLSELQQDYYTFEKDYFIAVGATFAHKNLEVIIDALYRRKDTNDFNLIIVGGNSKYRRKLEELVFTLNLSNCVKFLGYVSNKQLVTLYQKSLGLIYPSLYEGFGLPILEAMACGCPVIASNIEVFHEVGSDSILYFDPLSSDSLNHSIDTILYDLKIRAELIRKGKMRTHEFSWKKAAEEIYSIFIKLTSQESNK